MDWLLLGDGGENPRQREQSRSKADLETDLAIEIRQYIHRRESEGAFDFGDGGTRLALDRWIVDGAGLLAELRMAEEKRVRAWIEWEERTSHLRAIADDIMGVLEAMVPFLPSDSKEMGRQVYQLGRAALESRSFYSGLGVPEAPNTYRAIHERDRSHPVLGPAAALAAIKADGQLDNVPPPWPLAERTRAGLARLPPDSGSVDKLNR